MFRFLFIALFVALTSAFMAPVQPAKLSMSKVAMNEATRDAAPPPPAKSGWSLTMAGGQLTREMVKKAQQKAAKAAAGPDDSSGVPDDVKRYAKGW